MKWLLVLFILIFTHANAAKVSLQVLGSGGPELNDNRASSSYIIWVDGKSKVLVDFGGGASLNFEKANANIEDLEAILLTHLHIDHTADIPALLKASFFTHRQRNLSVFGPDKSRLTPSTNLFIEQLFKENQGAWQYMSDFLDGNAAYMLTPKTIKFSKHVSTIYKKGNIQIDAVSVHHGPLPAIAYKVTIGNKSISFTGDMSNQHKTMQVLAKDSSILVAHNAVPENAKGVAINLHMKPSEIGKLANNAQVKQLVLSHRMNRTLGNEEQNLAEISKSYSGPIAFADDLSLYELK